MEHISYTILLKRQTKQEVIVGAFLTLIEGELHFGSIMRKCSFTCFGQIMEIPLDLLLWNGELLLAHML